MSPTVLFTSENKKITKLKFPPINNEKAQDFGTASKCASMELTPY